MFTLTNIDISTKTFSDLKAQIAALSSDFPVERQAMFVGDTREELQYDKTIKYYDDFVDWGVEPRQFVLRRPKSWYMKPAEDGYSILCCSDDSGTVYDQTNWNKATVLMSLDITEYKLDQTDQIIFPGDSVYMLKGTYKLSKTMNTYGHFYGGFSGTEKSIDDRDFMANETILDIMSIESGQKDLIDIVTTNFVLDGFTVSSDSSITPQYGITATIDRIFYYPTIRNCIIKNRELPPLIESGAS